MCVYEDLETLLRIRLRCGEGCSAYLEYRSYEERGLEDALATLHRLAGKGCNHAFICQALKQRYLRWLDAGGWTDPRRFKKGVAFSVGYFRLIHELELMSSEAPKA
jgi:hypothetical protein